MITLVQLKHFSVLAQAGSFVRASGLLHLTQPALSRSIRALEDELGRPLFDRVGRRIELTAFGRDALLRARQLLEAAEQLMQSSGGPGALTGGRLRLGLSSGPGVMLTTPVISHFASCHPRFHVDLVRANTHALAHMLRERTIDAMVVDARSLRPAPDLEIEPAFEMRGAFMCRPGHPLTKLSRVTIDRLLNYPVVSTPLSDELARVLVERYGHSAHPDEMVRLTSDEISHLIDVTSQSDTVLLAIRASAPALHELAVTPALNANARFALVTLSGRSQSLALPEIRQLMASVLREPSPPEASPKPKRKS
jgi:DNA-binding transcriptional LysR family regulator